MRNLRNRKTDKVKTHPGAKGSRHSNKGGKGNNAGSKTTMKCGKTVKNRKQQYTSITA